MMLSRSSSKTGTERKRPAATSARICRPTVDLLVLARVRQREADAQRVADAAREQLLEGDARLDDALGRDAGLGHAEVQRHVRARLGEAAVGLDHLARVGVLEAHDVALEAEVVHVAAVLERRLDHGLRRRRSGKRAFISGSTLPQLTPMRIARSCSRATSTRKRDLLAHRLRPLVVPEVAGVVADLVDVRGDARGEPVALLQVDDEVGLRLPADLGEGLDVLRAVDGDAHEGAAGARGSPRPARRWRPRPGCGWRTCSGRRRGGRRRGRRSRRGRCGWGFS